MADDNDEAEAEAEVEVEAEADAENELEILKSSAKKSKIFRILTEEDADDLPEVVTAHEELPPLAINLSEIERQEYNEKLNDLSKDFSYNLRINRLLVKKCAEYFRRKKVEHVFSEADDCQKTEYQYQRFLNQYLEAKENFEVETSRLQNEVSCLEETVNGNLSRAAQQLNELFNRKSEVCCDLMAQERRKPSFKRVIEKVLQKLQLKFGQLNENRLEFLKYQHFVKNLKVEIENYEKFNLTLNIIDFDHLQTKNENLLSKIEEKNDSLSKLRTVYEKNCARCGFLEKKSQINHFELSALESDYAKCGNSCAQLRKRLNDSKRVREAYRKKISNLIEKGELSHHSAILNHMQKLIRELDEVQSRYLLLKYEYHKN